MIDEINTISDYNQLPSFLRHSTRSIGQSVAGLSCYKTSAERKASIQKAVGQAVDEGFITLRLAIEFLITNNAYGPKGKALIEERTSR